MSHARVTVDTPRQGVAVVVVDHPPANALTYALRLRLRETWEQLRDDDDVHAIVVTGAGERFFSAGLDIGELADDFDRWRDEPEVMHERIDLLRWDMESAELWKPTIAAINGYCLAGGWYLAQMCDVRIAVGEAEFGIPEGRLGLPAVFAWELPKFLPLNVALEAALWAERRFGAARMYELGWLNAVVPRSDLLDVALDWAAEVAQLPPAAVRAHKQLLYATSSSHKDDLRRRAEMLVRPLYDSPDPATRTSSFVSGEPAT